MTEALGMRDRVRLESEVDHIGVWPDAQNPAARQPGPVGRCPEPREPELSRPRTSD